MKLSEHSNEELVKLFRDTVTNLINDSEPLISNDNAFDCAIVEMELLSRMNG